MGYGYVDIDLRSDHSGISGLSGSRTVDQKTGIGGKTGMSEIPTHYQRLNRDLIPEWRARFSPEVFQVICMTHVERYLTHYRRKAGIEDLMKAADYFRWLVESYAAEMDEKPPVLPVKRFYGARGADVFAELDVSTYGDLIRLTGCRSEIDITTGEAISLCRTLIDAIKRVNPEFGEWQLEGHGHA